MKAIAYGKAELIKAWVCALSSLFMQVWHGLTFQGRCVWAGFQPFPRFRQRPYQAKKKRFSSWLCNRKWSKHLKGVRNTPCFSAVEKETTFPRLWSDLVCFFHQPFFPVHPAPARLLSGDGYQSLKPIASAPSPGSVALL